MTFVERLDYLIKEKGITRNQLLSELNLGRNSFVNWSSRDALPNGSTIIILAKYFEVSTDFLLGLTSNPNGNNSKSSGRSSGHDRAYDFLRYRVGWEDAEFMFKAADIPIDDSQYSIPPKALQWIAAHSGVGLMCLAFNAEIDKSELDGTPYYSGELENLDDLLKDPEIEIWENKYLKAKYDKYAEIAERKLWKADNGLQIEIFQGFRELIDQFNGDIGSQFALLDRCRQVAKQLSEEVALRKERA